MDTMRPQACKFRIISGIYSLARSSTWPFSHTSRISRMAAIMLSRKMTVDVSSHERFDSIPNLMTFDPARSALQGQGQRGKEAGRWKRTVDSVAVRPNGAEAGAPEAVSGAETTRTEDPGRALLVQRVVEDRVRLALAEQELEAHEVAVAALAGGRVAREGVVRLGGDGEELVAPLVLFAGTCISWERRLGPNGVDARR